MAVHLIVDNCGEHKHAKLKDSLARRPRCHVLFTPNSTVADFNRKFEVFVTQYNRHPMPFMWASAADSTLGKI